MSKPIRVTVWNEFIHERDENHPASKIYPNGIHHAIASHLDKQPDLKVRTATLDQPKHGLTDEVLEETDVLIWWGHCGHNLVSDELVDKLQTKVLGGMGLIVLHSGHFSKIFKRLMGTTCNLTWRETDEKERVWVIDHSHPITQGLEGSYFEYPQAEMYGEPFDIPQPDELVFVSWYEGGQVFRSGCCWHRGRGKIFYFSGAHETYPTYYDENVQLVITNGVRWAAPLQTPVQMFGHRPQPLEELK
ncbi:MAG TPA: ThuA domain-containing protein [Armatimonadota bacterium]|jgi:trehalose utilization protein